MKINPKCDIYFTGAKSKRKIKVLRNVIAEIDEEELKGLDPADYTVVSDGKPGDVVPEVVPPKSKKK